jgi:very-short-patch-repair endonuclease
LINYLDTTINQVPRGDLERLIRQGERAIENDAQVVQKGSETATYQFQVPESVRTYAAEIDQALAAIKICDPAIGSGAFPVGMMQEIVKVRGVLTTYLALTPSPSPLGEGSLPSPPAPLPPSPNPLPGERASGSPPSPQGEGGRGDEGDPVAGKLRQVSRALLERARELRSTQTATEQILWECLRDRRLNNFKFRRQHNIGWYIADFYCHEARLVIELDGGVHQTQTDRDRDRDAWMQSQNLRVLRLTNEQVLENLEAVLQVILNALTPNPSPQAEGSRTSSPNPLSPSPNPLPRERASGSPPSPWGEGGRGDEGRSAYAFKRHAIQSSIYGVDIDPGAVDIAKLRLWLSLVVDEEDYESIKPLPNLDYKIVCGNSLLSVEKNLFNHQVFAELEQRKQEYFEETNPDRKTALRTTIQGLIQTITNQAETFDFEVYFSEVFQQQGGFDVVIGNPPYVRQEQIKHLKDLLKPHYESFTGTADLYVFFYEKGLNLLREQGVLTYISSNKWFRAAYGKKLRQLIARETQLQQIIDFGDAPVFAAIAYPAIVITQKGKPSSPSPFSLEEKGSKTNPVPLSVQKVEENVQDVLGTKGSKTDPVPLSPRATADQNPVPLSPGRGARGEGHFLALNWEMGQPISQFETVVKSQSFTMPQQVLTAEGWQFADTTALNLLEKLRQAGTPLGEYVNNRFYYGIKTGFNEAFVVDRTTRDRLIAEHPSSAEVLKPFLRGRDVKRWIVDYQDLWLLFIPWHFPLHLDPTIEGASKKAEQAFKEQYPAIYKHLLGFKTELSNRNKAETGIRYEWYALQRCAATYWQEFERSKIFIPAIAQSVEYAADSAGFYGNDKTNICVTDEVEFLLGILNSKPMWWFIQQIAASKQGDFYEFKPMYVTQIPIPPAAPADKSRIETLVQQCLDAQGKDVAPYEAEIDNIVARLYGLTEAERAIIAGREG